ncbi:MAG TPA: choice-of-anchor tandem repeat GloVer-containing protein [Terriglobales bacterium]
MPPKSACGARSVSAISAFIFILIFVAVVPTSASSEQVVYSFGNNGSDGQIPYAGLIADAQGNLYGTTALGGISNCGTVFELSPSGSSWSETILYSFKGNGDGCEPYAGVIFDASGNLYGTTYTGGGYGEGTVFELSQNSKGQWTERLLYALHASQGSSPVGGVIFDSSGNLYGTAVAGGTGYCTDGCGIVFKLTPKAKGQWTETVLHSFQANSDGMWPYSGLMFDASGNLYGTTFGGGAYAAGTVYELKPSGSAWNESLIYSFQPNGQDGTQPAAGLIMDGVGNLYGTTVSGGTFQGGTAFELSAGSKSWSEKILHNFGKAGDGANPYAGLVLNGGKLRGTTSAGGTKGSWGTVFGIDEVSGVWQEWLTYSFQNKSSGGYGPYFGSLLQEGGNYYGTTPYGGSHCGATGCGTVFMVAP